MYPVLFKISSIEVRSYYVLWTFALLLFILWTRKRSVGRFRISWESASSVILWIYIAAILGASAGSVLEKVPMWLAKDIGARDMLKGGMSSASGLLCGGLAGFYRLKKLNIPVDDFAEASSVPLAFMIAIGRVGCFLNGCCLGIGRFFAGSPPLCSAHFPFDAEGFYRFPSQLAESAAAFAIGAVMVAAERIMDRRGVKANGAVLFPLFLVLYGAYRFAFEALRVNEWPADPNAARYMYAACVVIGGVWLARTAKITRG